jgi:hypothetical protein
MPRRGLRLLEIVVGTPISDADRQELTSRFGADEVRARRQDGDGGAVARPTALPSRAVRFGCSR